MKGLWKKLVLTVAIALGLVVPMVPAVMSEPVVALAPTEIVAEQVETNLFGKVDIDDKGSGIKKILGLVVRILLYGIGVVAVIGVVVAGIMYLTARDNEQQVAKAKTRLFEVAIGLIVWALLFVVLRWLIPGFSESKLNEFVDTSFVTVTEQC